MVDSVAVYGGFAGNESALGARDWETNESVLSGYLDGNDDDTYELDNSLCGNGENSRNVVVVVVACEGARLDGLTIRGGNADEDAAVRAGAGVSVYCSESFAISNCLLTRNMVVHGGGAALDLWYGCSDGSHDARIEDCWFYDNVLTGFNTEGGAVRIVTASEQAQCHVAVNGCGFYGNVADGDGGAMYVDAEQGVCTLSVMQTVFAQNVAETGGLWAAMVRACRCSLMAAYCGEMSQVSTVARRNATTAWSAFL